MSKSPDAVRKLVVAGGLTLALLATSGVTAAQATTERVVYSFTHRDQPTGKLLNVGGTLYGTTFHGGTTGCLYPECGTVFQLTPPAIAGATWTEKVIYRFKGGRDGSNPERLINAGGAIYGTTRYGGGGRCAFAAGCGTVFELTPPAVAGNAWTEKVIYRFRVGSDGSDPTALIGAGGALYGTTGYGGGPGQGFGTVFELTPPPRDRRRDLDRDRAPCIHRA